MAKATRTVESVTTIVKEEVFTLKLNRDEAEVLLLLAGYATGSVNTGRRHASAIYDQLAGTGISFTAAYDKYLPTWGTRFKKEI